MTQYWYTFTLNEAEWVTLQAALSYYDVHLRIPKRHRPTGYARVDRGGLEHFRAKLDMAPAHKSERDYSIDELNERARNDRWPHVAERRKSPETRTIFHWRTITLGDLEWSTLKEVLVQYTSHCDLKLKSGATVPFLAHREGLEDIQAKLDNKLNHGEGATYTGAELEQMYRSKATHTDAEPRRKLRSTSIPSGMHGLTLDETEWNALEATLPYCEAHLGEWIPNGPMKDVPLDQDAIERLRAELDKAVKRRSEQEFTKDQLHERTRNNRWPDVGKRPKSPKATIYYWRTIILDDGVWTTLERAMAQYHDHCEWQLANKTRDPFLFIEHRHGIRCIRTKLDLSRMDD